MGCFLRGSGRGLGVWNKRITHLGFVIGGGIILGRESTQDSLTGFVKRGGCGGVY